MSHRRREDEEWVWSIGRLVALLLTFPLAYPPFRQEIPTEGLVFLGILIGLLVVGGLSRPVRSTLSGWWSGHRATPLQSSFWTAQAPSTYLPQSTYELLRQLRQGDDKLVNQVLSLVYQKLDYRISRNLHMPLIVERGGTCHGVRYSSGQGRVGVKTIRQFRDALTSAKLEQGIMITADGYTHQAKKLAGTLGIQVLEEAEFGSLLEATRAGHDTAILAVLPNSRPTPAENRDLSALTTAQGP